jgi:hypothetical protein
MSGAGWRQFAANEILTSTNVQNYLQDQAVMRFASATARNSAITAPTQGMTAYLDDTGLTTQYFSAGTGGRATAGWYAIGTQLIKAVAIGSGVSSVTVSNCFSADFDLYRAVIVGGVASTSTGQYLKFGSTTTGYYSVRTASAYSDGSAGAVQYVSNGSAFFNLGMSNTNGISFDVNIVAPFSAERTRISGPYVAINTSGGVAGTYGGFLDDTNSYTSLTLTPGSGTYTGGTLYVYGIGK